MDSGKVFKVFDHVCDIIPGISTVSNASELIYNLAHKVNAAANPVHSGWKDAIKIHVTTKSRFENIMGMIPIIGNIFHLVKWIVTGGRNPLKRAIKNQNNETLALYLGKHGESLSPEKKGEMLKLAVSTENFYAIEKLADLEGEWDIGALQWCLEQTAKSGDWENAKKVFNLFPEGSPLTVFENVLLGSSPLSSNNEDWENIDKLKTLLLDRCQPSLEDALTYLSTVREQRATLDNTLERHNADPRNQKIDKEEAVENFNQTQTKIIACLLRKLPKEANPMLRSRAVTKLIAQGELEIFEQLAAQFPQLLTPNNLHTFALNIAWSQEEFMSMNPDTLDSLEKFMTIYRDDLNIEHLIEGFKSHPNLPKYARNMIIHRLETILNR